MNDFTKEELEEIYNLVEFSIADYGESSSKSINLLIPLSLKTQLMIDNYCEHEYKKTLAESGMYFINMCHKCKDTKPWNIFNE